MEAVGRRSQHGRQKIPTVMTRWPLHARRRCNQSSSKKTPILKLKVSGTTGCAAGDPTEKATGSVTGFTASTAVTS